MTHLHRGDADLHNADGTHRSTPPTANGRVLAQYQERLLRHLAEHVLLADKHEDES